MCFPSGCCRRPLARRRGLAAQQRGPPAGCGLPHDAAPHRRPPQAPHPPLRSRLSTSSDVAPCLLKSPFVHLDGTKQNHAAEAEARPTAARGSGGTSSSINGFFHIIVAIFYRSIQISISVYVVLSEPIGKVAVYCNGSVIEVENETRTSAVYMF